MEKRGINPETAVRLGIHTGSKNADGDVVPDEKGNILVFPIIEGGVTVGEKYRGPNKVFWQKKGSKQTFINGDVLDDPTLRATLDPRAEIYTQSLVIVEGEPDLLTALDLGAIAVSVPAGAPAPPKEKKDDDQVDDDSTGKFEFLWHNRDRLKQIKRFVIAVDNDTNGKYLAEELVRRLGASRCYFVTYPAGCKDLNQVMMELGAEAAHEALKNAKAYPLKGIYALSDYPDKPKIQTFKTGWPILDTVFKPFAPSFNVVTGLPGSGKSTWLTHHAINMAEDHGWKWAIFSPELPVSPHLRDKMRRMILGVAENEMQPQHIARADRFINEHFVFIDFDVTGDDDEDLTVDWVLDRTYDALMRHGIRGAIYDPWNEFEHAVRRGESVTEYTNRMLRKVIKFGRRHGLAIYVVAHPTKEVGKDGKLRVPTLYDIEGSAAWFNKPDIGIVVHRPNIASDTTEIHLKKVRFEGTGDRGQINLKFNRDNSRFEQLQPNQPDMLGPP